MSKGSNLLFGSACAALFAAAVVGTVGLSDEEGAKKALQNQGWEPVQSQGHVIMGCDKGDMFRNKFTAKNPQGKEVEVVVCSGLMKGATIRTR